MPPAEVYTRSSLKSALKWIATIALLGLAGTYLWQNLTWSDAYELPQGPRGALIQDESHPARLHLSDGTLLPLTPEQERSLVRVRGLQSTLIAAPASRLMVAAAFMLLAIGAVAVRWRAILTLLGHDIPLSTAWRISFEAQGLALLLPGAIGGDVYRVGWLMRSGVSTASAALSVALDRLIGLWIFLFAAGVVANGSPFGDRWALLGWLPWLLLAGALMAAAGFALLPATWLPTRARETVVLLRNALLRRPEAVVVAAASSFVNSALHCANILIVMSALGAVLPSISEAIVGTSLGMLASSLPLTPSGIGVGEAALVFIFGRMGVASTDVLATMLLLRAVTFGLATVAVAGHVWRSVRQFISRRLAFQQGSACD